MAEAEHVEPTRIRIHVAVLLAVCAGILAGAASPGHTVGLVVGGVAFVAVWAWVRRAVLREDLRVLMPIFVVTLVVRVVAAVGFHAALVAGGGDGAINPDETGYVQAAEQMADAWRRHGLVEGSKGAAAYAGALPGPGYIVLTAILFLVTGPSMLAMKLINACVGGVACIFIFYATLNILGRDHPLSRRAAALACLLVAFLPANILWSLTNLKESSCATIVAGLVWATSEALWWRSKRRLLTVLVLLGILCAFRFLAAAIILPVFVSAVFVRPGTSRSRVVTRSLVLAGAAALMLYFVGLGHLVQRVRGFMTPATVAYVRQTLTWGGSAFLANVNLTSPGAVLKFLPIGTAYFLFSPFPWNLRMESISLVLAFFENLLLWYPLAPFALGGLIYTWRNRWREGYTLLGIVILVSLVLGLLEGNIGTAFRHRSLIMPLLLSLAAISLTRHFAGRFGWSRGA